MVFYVIIIAITAVVFGGIFLLRWYSDLRKYLPGLRGVLQAGVLTVDYWGFKRSYSDGAKVLLRYTNLSETLSVVGTDLRQARKKVASFVRDAYETFYPGRERDVAVERLAAASYMMLLSHEELLAVVASLHNHKDLEVRKATYIAIDVLGEMFDLKDDLSQEYFQHLIYGINKSLVLLKKSGYDKKTLKKVTSTLWRVYKLTKAYNYLQGRKNLTKEEFYAKVSGVFGTLFRMVG